MNYQTPYSRPIVPLIWNPEKLHFRNEVWDARVARSPTHSALEREMDSLRPTLEKGAALFFRSPPLIQGKLKGHSPKGSPIFEWISRDCELWKVNGLGSFDSIRFARSIFNCPEDGTFFEGVDSLEAIIAMLSEGFAEGDFRVYQVSESSLLFNVTKPNTKVTRKQYALLDKLNARFFTGGPHMRADRSCAPQFFKIGSIGSD